MDSPLESVLDLTSAIRRERDPENRLRMLQEFNESLPKDIKLEMPSLVTNAYVRRALDIIEERAITTLSMETTSHS
jgi:hypothetical protein